VDKKTGKRSQEESSDVIFEYYLEENSPKIN
jgi:hypothetical protein